jgi:hypothetical protein
MNFWRRFHERRWFVRWPVKAALLAATVFLVCFPYPWVFVRHVQRWRNPNAMIDPDAPVLAPWIEEVRAQLASEMQPPQVLKRVEHFVYEHVKYQWDWVNWGVADYLPTVAEVMAKGSEDCDGRAVIAASMLRKLGYRADLVTDFAHVWVRTDRGDTMSPGRPPAVIARDTGFKIDFSAITNLIPATAYGLSPFPLERELIVLTMLWLLLLAPGFGRTASLLGMICLIDGLLLMRVGGQHWQQPVVWMQWVGALSMLLAVALMLARGAAARSRQRAQTLAVGAPA